MTPALCSACRTDKDVSYRVRDGWMCRKCRGLATGDLVMRDEMPSTFGTVVAAGPSRIAVVWQDNRRRYYVKHQWYRLVPVPANREDEARKALAQKARR